MAYRQHTTLPSCTLERCDRLGVMAAEGAWLIGADGLYRGGLGEWRRLGEARFLVNALSGDSAAVVAATNGGLWQIDPESGSWRQLHDETLTEVQCVIGTADGLVAGSPYGVAIAATDDLDALRWTCLTERLEIPARYTYSVLIIRDRAQVWLAGTEGGVLISEDAGGTWRWTGLTGRPVYCLLELAGQLVAGTGGGSVYASSDGEDWVSQPIPQADATIFSLAARGAELLAGSASGVWVRGMDASWVRRSPRLQVTAVAVSQHDDRTWLAGASPGGLWSTQDAGETWRQEAIAADVRAVRWVGVSS